MGIKRGAKAVRGAAALALRVEGSTALMFLASLGLYLVLDGASHLLLSRLKCHLLREASVTSEPGALVRVNYLVAAAHLLLVVVVVLAFYLIGRSVDLRERFLSSVLSLILGSFVGSLVQVSVAYGGPLTVDAIVAALLNVFVQRYFFFIAFTGVAMGHIRARS